MSSYHNVSQETEWCFDGASMPNFAASPLAHRTSATNYMDGVDPQEYYQRMANVHTDPEQCMDGANFLMTPGLVSPTGIIPSVWTTELANHAAAYGRGTANMAGFTAAAAAVPMSAGMGMTSMFAPAPQSNLVSALAARRANNARQMGHRSSLSDAPTLPKAPLQISTNHHHRSRSSIQSFTEMPALFSPFTADMTRSLSTASSATELSDLQTSPIRPTASRKTSAKSNPSLVSKSENAEPGANMVRIQSVDGTSREVGVLPRTPKHSHNRSQGSQKLTCDYCNEVPDGFRGEHELMRHYNLRHAPRRKAFICIEPPGQEGFFAQVGCRSCKEKKLYGAYYNAAAHLRRVHFDPRPRGRKAKGTERRGGKAGGNNPPMEILKTHWIREVDVANTNHAARNRNLADNEDFGEDSNEDELQLPRGGSNHGSRTSSTSSSSSSGASAGAGDAAAADGGVGSDDEATLLTSSLNEDVAEGLPPFDLHGQPQVSLPYPPFNAGATAINSATIATSSADTSPLTATDAAAAVSTSPLSWQQTLSTAAPFSSDAAAADGIAWSESDAAGILMPQMSPGFESIDAAFNAMNQHPDLYMTWP